MLRLLTTAAKVVGLTYSILSSVVLIGLLTHGVIKHVRQQKSGS